MASGYSPSSAFKQLTRTADDVARKMTSSVDLLAKAQSLTQGYADAVDKAFNAATDKARRQAMAVADDCYRGMEKVAQQMADQQKILGDSMDKSLKNSYNGWMHLEYRKSETVMKMLRSQIQMTEDLNRKDPFARLHRSTTKFMSDQARLAGLNMSSIKDLESQSKAYYETFKRVIASTDRWSKARAGADLEDQAKKLFEDAASLKELLEVFGDTLPEAQRAKMEQIVKETESSVGKVHKAFEVSTKKKLKLEKDIERVQMARSKSVGSQILGIMKDWREVYRDTRIMKISDWVESTGLGKLSQGVGKNKVDLRNALNISSDDFQGLSSALRQASRELGSKVSQGEVFDAAQALVPLGIRDNESLSKIAPQVVRISKILNVNSSQFNAFAHKWANMGIRNQSVTQRMYEALAAGNSNKLTGDKMAGVAAMGVDTTQRLLDHITGNMKRGKARDEAMANAGKELIKSAEAVADLNMSGEWIAKQMWAAVEGTEGAWRFGGNSAELRQLAVQGKQVEFTQKLLTGLSDLLRNQNEASRSGLGQAMGLDQNQIFRLSRTDAVDDINESFAKMHEAQAEGNALQKGMENHQVSLLSRIGNEIAKWEPVNWFSDFAAKTGVTMDDIFQVAALTEAGVKTIIRLKEIEMATGFFSGKGGNWLKSFLTKGGGVVTGAKMFGKGFAGGLTGSKALATTGSFWGTAGKVLGKAAPWIAGAVTAYEGMAEVAQLQKKGLKQEAMKKRNETIGKTVGVVSGTIAGAKIGAAIGALGGPIGIAVGGVVGSVIGGFVGSSAGGALGRDFTSGTVNRRSTETRTSKEIDALEEKLNIAELSRPVMARDPTINRVQKGLTSETPWYKAEYVPAHDAEEYRTFYKRNHRGKRIKGKAGVRKKVKVYKPESVKIDDTETRAIQQRVEGWQAAENYQKKKLEEALEKASKLRGATMRKAAETAARDVYNQEMKRISDDKKMFGTAVAPYVQYLGAHNLFARDLMAQEGVTEASKLTEASKNKAWEAETLVNKYQSIVTPQALKDYEKALAGGDKNSAEKIKKKLDKAARDLSEGFKNLGVSLDDYAIGALAKISDSVKAVREAENESLSTQTENWRVWDEMNSRRNEENFTENWIKRSPYIDQSRRPVAGRNSDTFSSLNASPDSGVNGRRLSEQWSIEPEVGMRKNRWIDLKNGLGQLNKTDTVGIHEWESANGDFQSNIAEGMDEFGKRVVYFFKESGDDLPTMADYMNADLAQGVQGKLGKSMEEFLDLEEAVADALASGTKEDKAKAQALFRKMKGEARVIDAKDLNYIMSMPAKITDRLIDDFEAKKFAGQASKTRDYSKPIEEARKKVEDDLLNRVRTDTSGMYKEFFGADMSEKEIAQKIHELLYKRNKKGKEIGAKNYQEVALALERAALRNKTENYFGTEKFNMSEKGGGEFVKNTLTAKDKTQFWDIAQHSATDQDFQKANAKEIARINSVYRNQEERAMALANAYRQYQEEGMTDQKRWDNERYTRIKRGGKTPDEMLQEQYEAARNGGRWVETGIERNAYGVKRKTTIDAKGNATAQYMYEEFLSKHPELQEKVAAYQEKLSKEDWSPEEFVQKVEDYKAGISEKWIAQDQRRKGLEAAGLTEDQYGELVDERRDLYQTTTAADKIRDQMVKLKGDGEGFIGNLGEEQFAQLLRDKKAIDEGTYKAPVKPGRKGGEKYQQQQKEKVEAAYAELKERAKEAGVDFDEFVKNYQTALKGMGGSWNAEVLDKNKARLKELGEKVKSAQEKLNEAVADSFEMTHERVSAVAEALKPENQGLTDAQYASKIEMDESIVKSLDELNEAVAKEWGDIHGWGSGDAVEAYNLARESGDWQKFQEANKDAIAAVDQNMQDQTNTQAALAKMYQSWKRGDSATQEAVKAAKDKHESFMEVSKNLQRDAEADFEERRYIGDVEVPEGVNPLVPLEEQGILPQPPTMAEALMPGDATPPAMPVPIDPNNTMGDDAESQSMAELEGVYHQEDMDQAKKQVEEQQTTNSLLRQLNQNFQRRNTVQSPVYGAGYGESMLEQNHRVTDQGALC